MGLRRTNGVDGILIPDWLWVLLGISFVTTILFGIANAKRLNKLEDDWKRRYGGA